ncbi:translation activator [Aureococcus anophagefferens]|nr:translation activator [Aureococcus anophagefferens]
MGKAKGKKGKRGQESDDDDDYVDPIKAAMAAAGGDGDDEPAGMATKKGNKKKGKGKKGAESDDDEPPAPEPAKQLTKAQERKAKKKGKNAATAPRGRASARRRRTTARRRSRAARSCASRRRRRRAARPPSPTARTRTRSRRRPRRGGGGGEEEDAPAPLPAASSRKKDKKAQRKAAAMAAMAADESDEEEEEPAEEGKKKMSKAERRKLKSKGGDEAPEPEAAEEAEEAKVVDETAPADVNAMFGGKKKKKSAFGAAAAAADSGPRPAAPSAFAAAMAAAEDDDDGAGGDAGELGSASTIAAAERARAAEREAGRGEGGGMAGGLLSKDDGVWRDDSNDKLGPNAGPVVEATFDICLERAVAANGGKPLSSKAKRKLEKDYASRKREAEELKAKELANALGVKIDSFTISAAGKTLFQDASLLIAHGKRYGIVGPNGRGKTTLLKMIASGDLKTPPRVQCLYVEQEVQADDTCAVDAVVRADAERSALLAEEKALAAKLEAGGLAAEDQQATSERLSAVGSELLAIGAHAAESKARRILFGLGFSAEMQQRATKLFSGGWRMRISLALFMEPVLLMLDEPTNHLDLNAVIWLDDYLQNEADARPLPGNYDTFKTLEQQKRAAQLKAWEKQEKQLRALKGKSNSRPRPRLVMKAAAKREPARSKKAQAIAAGQDTADVAALIEKPKEYLVEMEFPPVTKLSPPVLQVMDAHFRSAPDLPHIFNDMNFGIDQDSRVCIVGNNGSGKTTLLHLLTGKLAATEGEIKRNPRLRIGVYNQHFVERLPMDESPVDYLRRLFNDETYQSVRNMLGRYGLQGHAHTIAMRDSGGQKARVVLCRRTRRAHMLLLDEPTNNLDIETIGGCDARRVLGADGDACDEGTKSPTERRRDGEPDRRRDRAAVGGAVGGAGRGRGTVGGADGDDPRADDRRARGRADGAPATAAPADREPSSPPTTSAPRARPLDVADDLYADRRADAQPDRRADARADARADDERADGLALCGNQIFNQTSICA